MLKWSWGWGDRGERSQGADPDILGTVWSWVRGWRPGRGPLGDRPGSPGCDRVLPARAGRARVVTGTQRRRRALWGPSSLSGLLSPVLASGPPKQAAEEQKRVETSASTPVRRGVLGGSRQVQRPRPLSPASSAISWSPPPRLWTEVNFTVYSAPRLLMCSRYHSEVTDT